MIAWRCWITVTLAFSHGALLKRPCYRRVPYSSRNNLKTLASSRRQLWPTSQASWLQNHLPVVYFQMVTTDWLVVDMLHAQVVFITSVWPTYTLHGLSSQERQHFSFTLFSADLYSANSYACFMVLITYPNMQELVHLPIYFVFMSWCIHFLMSRVCKQLLLQKVLLVQILCTEAA